MEEGESNEKQTRFINWRSKILVELLEDKNRSQAAIAQKLGLQPQVVSIAISGICQEDFLVRERVKRGMRNTYTFDLDKLKEHPDIVIMKRIVDAVFSEPEVGTSDRTRGQT